MKIIIKETELNVEDIDISEVYIDAEETNKDCLAFRIYKENVKEWIYIKKRMNKYYVNKEEIEDIGLIKAIDKLHSHSLSCEELSKEYHNKLEQLIKDNYGEEKNDK